MANSTHASGPLGSASITKDLGVSLLIHGAILGLVFVKNPFFSSQPLEWPEAIRVDLAELPDKIRPQEAAPLPEEKKPDPLPLPNPAPAELPPKDTKVDLPSQPKVDKSSIDLLKKKQKAAFDRLKGLSALERIRDDVTQETLKKQPIKGNQVSPGSDPKGIQKLQLMNYTRSLDRHLKSFWALPEWLAKAKLKAKAKVFLSSDGQVIGRELIESSGQVDFDKSVLETIDRSNPLPAPPENLTEKLRVDGITIEFGQGSRL